MGRWVMKEGLCADVCVNGRRGGRGGGGCCG